MNGEVFWSEASDELKRKFVGALNYETRCTLRKCSRTERSLVDSCPLRLAQLKLVIDLCHVRIHILAPDDFPIFVHYHKYQMGCKMKIIWRSTLREKIFENEHFLTMALRDFEILARQRKLIVDDFLVFTCPEGVSLEMLKHVMTSSEKKIETKKFRFCGDVDHTDFFKTFIEAEDVEYQHYTLS